jgi:DNA-binding MarR family transcriptional regulator
VPTRRLPRRPNPLFQLFVLGQLTRSLFDREFGARGLSHEGFGVVSAVGATHPVTPTDLADLLGMAPSTLSAQIARLVKEGVITRVPNPADRRSYTLELTPAGHEYMRTAGPALRATLLAVDAELDRPRDEVVYALELLEAAMRRALASSSESK